MDLTDIIYSNDYINILIQNYVAQSERYQMLFPESSALLTLNPVSYTHLTLPTT